MILIVTSLHFVDYTVLTFKLVLREPNIFSWNKPFFHDELAPCYSFAGF